MNDHATSSPQNPYPALEHPVAGVGTRRALSAALLTCVLALVSLRLVPATLAQRAAASETLLQPPSQVFVDDNFDATTPGWQVTHFDSIQNGLDAVTFGGTVNVAAGEYEENLSITKIVTVTGTGTDTIIRSDDGTCFNPTTDTGATVIHVQSDFVTLDRLFIDGEIESTCGGPPEAPRARYGINLRSQAGFALRNTTIVSAVYGLFMESSLTTAQIRNNTVIDAGTAGIGAGMYFSATNRSIRDNVVRDSPDATGVVVVNGGQGFFQRNTISRVRTGLLVKSSALTAQSNTFVGHGIDNDIGIKLEEAGGGLIGSTLLTDNTIEGFTRGIDVIGGSQLMQENKIWGPGRDTAGSIGVRFSTELGPGQVREISLGSMADNLISNFERGIVVHEPPGDTSKDVFLLIGGSVGNSNTIALYRTFALELENTGDNVAVNDINAEFNNWGVTSLGSLEEVIKHKNDDPVLGRVDFDPFLGIPELINLTANPTTLRPNGTDTSTIRAQVLFLEQIGLQTVTKTVAPGMMVGFQTLKGLGTVSQAFVEAEGNNATRQGNWQTVSDGNASGNQYVRSNTVGDKVSFNFNGTAVSMLYRTGPDAGIANVTIDASNVFSDTLDMYSATAAFKERVIETALANGPHTLMVEVSGNKNTNASDTYVYADAFRSGLTTDEQGAVTATLLAGITAGIEEVLAVAVSEAGNITETIAVTISDATPTPTSTQTPTLTPTVTATSTSTTPTPPTVTPTVTPSPTPTPSGTPPALTVTPTRTRTPTPTPTRPRIVMAYLPLLARNLVNVVPKIVVVPADQRIQVGETTTVEVRITNVEDLFAVDVQVGFDPAVLEVVDANPDLNGIQIDPGTFPDPNDGGAIINQADNAAGRVTYVVTIFRPNPPVKGSGPLLFITFRGKAAGDSPITIRRAVLSDPDASSIAAAVNNGIIRVGALPTATPTRTLSPTPTITPGGPTLTRTPTITPGGPTLTSTPHAPVPTPTPTEKPAPGICQQIVLNPGFEENRSWTIPNTPRPARYTTANRFSGHRSILMGLTPYELDVLSFSSVWQAVRIPHDAQSATLSFRYWPATQEYTNNDWQASWIFDADLNMPPLASVLKIRSNAHRWFHHQQDLTSFRGQTITLYFTAINDGRHGHRTYWYVDDVTVEVCGSNSPLEIPAQPRKGPDEEMLLNLLMNDGP
jgi:hypothetical protein